MEESAALLQREAVIKAVQQIAHQNCIKNPKISAKVGSKNGENYSGEVYRITITETNDK